MTDPIATMEPRRRGRKSNHSFAGMVGGMALWTSGWWTALGLVLGPWVPGGWVVVAVVAIVTLVVPLAVFRQAMTGRLYPGALTRLLVFRPFWYLQLLLPLLGLAGILGAVAGLPFGASAITGRYAVAVAAGLLGVVGIAGWIGSRLLVTRRLIATLPDLPVGLEGLRIVQLSDLHVGPHTSRRHLARVRAAIRAAAPDLIVFTGDQVDDFPRDTEPFARAFSDLEAPLGVFAVAGNHDVYARWGAVRAGLERAGQRVLVNEAVELRRAGSSLWLAGTGDPAGRGFAMGRGGEAAPDLEATFANVPPGAFVVALAHNPVLWPALAERDVALTLSGHTHHGQLSVPHLSWSLASVFLEHAMGGYEADGALLYINPGTNYWGLPFRIGALPEVTVIELRPGKRAALTE